MAETLPQLPPAPRMIRFEDLQVDVDASKGARAIIIAPNDSSSSQRPAVVVSVEEVLFVALQPTLKHALHRHRNDKQCQQQQLLLCPLHVC